MPRSDPTPEIRAEEAEQARGVSLRRIARLFRPHRGPLAVGVAVIVASSIVALASPFLLRAVIDDALPRRDVRLLALLAGGMIAVAASTAALGVVQTWISTGVGQRVMHRLRTDVFAHLQRQSLGFFTRTRTGEVQSRITNDIGGMQTVVTSTATSIAANLTTVVATAVAMVALSWQLALVTLVVLPPAVLVSRRVARMRRALTAARQRELADLNVTIEEGLSVDAAALHRTLGTGPALVERFTASSARLTDLEQRSQLAGRWRMATMSVVFAAIPALIYVGAGLPWTVGQLSIGTLVAFTSLQAGVFRPLSGLLDVGVQVASSLALFARIFEYQDLVVEIADPEHPVELGDLHGDVRGDVRIEGVTFTHPGGDRPALDGVDLAIPAGTTLALVGETGSGKTTLGALVARLHDPDAGRITVDDVDLRDLRLADLAGIVGVVSQETYLRVLTMEAQTLARACGKAHVRHLE
ncbi:MAG TPA: ABC transporter ATP-binding protein, partial [Euzebyales bacterium]|nr:ABC transporter ATP-binding protein [Euzebyales bacterium]